METNGNGKRFDWMQVVVTVAALGAIVTGIATIYLAPLQSEVTRLREEVREHRGMPSHPDVAARVAVLEDRAKRASKCEP